MVGPISSIFFPQTQQIFDFDWFDNLQYKNKKTPGYKNGIVDDGELSDGLVKLLDAYRQYGQDGDQNRTGKRDIAFREFGYLRTIGGVPAASKVLGYWEAYTHEITPIPDDALAVVKELYSPVSNLHTYKYKESGDVTFETYIANLKKDIFDLLKVDVKNGIPKKVWEDYKLAKSREALERPKEQKKWYGQIFETQHYDVGAEGERHKDYKIPVN